MSWLTVLLKRWERLGTKRIEYTSGNWFRSRRTRSMAHILFLMSDTGGGHRAACRAIEAALRERHPDRFTFELVDLWKEYTPFPFNTIPQSAARWIDVNPSGFSAMFWMWDRLFRSRWWSTLFCKQMFLRMKRLYLEHPADIIVCVHAAFVRPAVYALRKMRIEKPFLKIGRAHV